MSEGWKKRTAWASALLLAVAGAAAGQPPASPLAPPGGPLPAPAPVVQPTNPPMVIGPPTAAPTGPLMPTPGLAPTPPPTAKPASHVSIHGRFQTIPDTKFFSLPNNVTAIVVTGGVTMFLSTPSEKPGGKANFVDIEADRVVIWMRGNSGDSAQAVTRPGGADLQADEVYMAGNVEVRTRTKTGEFITQRGDEIYYDVRREVAVNRNADLELQSVKLPYSVHVTTPELIQENAKVYTSAAVRVFSSLLPSDPGLTVDVSNFKVEEKTVPKKYLYGWWTPTGLDGQPVMETQRTFTGTNMVTKLDGVPVFYWPYVRGRVEDPLGPLEGLTMGYDRIFGFRFGTTWDIFELLDLPKPQGFRWRLNLDYLSERGLGFGTDLDFAGKNPFGIQGNYNGQVRLYGIFDQGHDILGGGRDTYNYWPDDVTTWPVTAPNFRGWATGKAMVQDMPDGFSVMGQFGFVSDRNFVEEYYLNTQLNDPNLDTFIQLKQQQGIWAWTLYSQVSTRDWLTETNWLPRADGYLLGQTISVGPYQDLIVSNTHIQAGYAQLLPTQQVPFAYLPQDVRVNTMRVDAMQDFSMPFNVGALKVVPYVIGDVAWYSEDVNSDSEGRAYGGAGIRLNLPLSRLYPDVHSELFNVDGLYHKINLLANYYASQSSTPLSNLPQLDRFFDDATDQSMRDIRPLQTLYNPGYASYLNYSQLFTPQNYALRRLIMDTPDALDTMNVMQLGIDQRLQTKRGFPGDEHVVDWMTLNVDISLFPHSLRDNFGHTLGIAEYDWRWNIGDRTSLMSQGWFEPWDKGPDAFDFGVATQRPDLTSFYFGYRQVDPIRTRAVVATIIYPLSTKYAVSASTVWDFGNQVMNYSLFVARQGTDVTVNFGVNYNSTLNTWGVMLEIVPNLARRSSKANAYFPSGMSNIDPTAASR